MKNLEQIRAGNAWKARNEEFKGKEGAKNIVKKLPALIRTNGVLNTLAFCLETKGDHEKLWDKITEHLKDGEIKLVKSQNARALCEELCKGESQLLRQVTAETIAYLNYLRRFVEVKE